MARERNDTDESYGEDIFDHPPVGPVGAHQGAASFWARTMPYVIVIIVAAAAGLLVWGMLSGELSRIHLPWSSDTASQTTDSDKQKDSDSADSSKDDGQSDSDKDKKSDADDVQKDSDKKEGEKPAQNQPAPAAANKQTSIKVANGTQIAGHAAAKQQMLQQAGYANATAGNIAGQAPSATVVWYQNEADKATAEDVAKVLGIAAVEQQTAISVPVEVVLMN